MKTLSMTYILMYIITYIHSYILTSQVMESALADKKKKNITKYFFLDLYKMYITWAVNLSSLMWRKTFWSKVLYS